VTVESLLNDRQVLYFVKSKTCAACAAAEPEFLAFERKHPALTTLSIDAEGPLPDRFGFKIKATPTYVFRRGAEAVMIAGAMKVRDIESWLKKLGASL
jgi:thiol-disulfide isomerase/thioredoxin